MAVLLLLLLPAAQPFEFLHGQEPIAKGERTISIGFSQNQADCSVYCFEADFDKFVARAGPELEAKGFKLDDTAARFGLDSLAIYGTDPMKEDRAIVTFHRDRKVSGQQARALANGSLMPSMAPTDVPGWITVTVVGGETPSFWRRLMSWVGL